MADIILSESILSVPPQTGYTSPVPATAPLPQGTSSLGAAEAALTAPLQNQLILKGNALIIGPAASVVAPPAGVNVSVTVNATVVPALEPQNMVATTTGTQNPGGSLAVNPAQVRTGPSW